MALNPVGKRRENQSNFFGHATNVIIAIERGACSAQGSTFGCALMISAACMQSINGTQAVIRSQAMQRLMKMVERVAAYETAVLIVGETGSGKELVARALHEHSPPAW